MQKFRGRKMWNNVISRVYEFFCLIFMRPKSWSVQKKGISILIADLVAQCQTKESLWSAGDVLIVAENGFNKFDIISETTFKCWQIPISCHFGFTSYNYFHKLSNSKSVFFFNFIQLSKNNTPKLLSSSRFNKYYRCLCLNVRWSCRTCCWTCPTWQICRNYVSKFCQKAFAFVRQT